MLKIAPDDVVPPEDAQASPATGAAAERELESLSHTGLVRRSTATLQVKLPDSLAVECPRCGSNNENHSLSLILSLGPLAEGAQLFLVKEEAGLTETLDELKRVLILRALAETNGNKAKAAKRLRIKYTTFHSMLQRLQIGQPSRRAIDANVLNPES